MSDEDVGDAESIAQPSDQTLSGKLFYVRLHTGAWCKHFAKNHWFLCAFGCLLTLVLLVSCRAAYHHLLLAAWKMGFLVFVFFCCAVLFYLRKPWRRFWKRSIIGKFASLAVTAILTTAVLFWGKDTYEYVTLWWRFFSLPLVDVATIPLTDYDRDLPRQVIVTGIKQTIHDASVQTTMPDLVRVGEKYGWSYAIVPGDKLFLRATGLVRKVGFVDATQPAPDFAKATETVCFATAENLLAGRNTKTAALWSLGFLKFFRYEPAETFFIKDDSHAWVQAVSLIRWTTFPVPMPEFGGVMIIPQDCHVSVVESTLRMFTGVGYYIAPEDVPKYEFLKGQNILPYAVSTYIGESFRFQGGFLEPMLTHYGDVRIPDLPEDLNKQPYTIFYRFGREDIPDSPQHSFTLEPWTKDVHGLNTSVYIPADGRNVVYRYRHAERGEAYLGVTAMSGFVRQSRPEITWGTAARDVEYRPYNKFVGGEIRPFFRSTVVALDPRDPTKFTAGGRPNTVITYPVTGAHSVWVDPVRPETWVAELEKEYAHLWTAK